MQRKRWTAIGIVVAILALCAAFVRVGPATAEADCGLGPPPDAPGFAEANTRTAAEVASSGFRHVCNADLARYDFALHSAAWLPSLAFTPVQLAGTPFARFESMGASIETFSGTASRLYRGFRTPDGHSLILSEHDMSADGSNAWRAPADEPERINGLPARLDVLEAPSGQAVSILTWTEGRRAYEFWIRANVAREPQLRKQLFALAAALPASVPACPNEPKPVVPRLGPDGLPEFDFPDHPPAEAAAPRPCK